MRIAATITRLRRFICQDDGFTMMVAIGVMLVSSLLLVATFTAADGDIRLTSTDASQKSAYYAALAGLSEYKYQLNSNPNYWLSCPSTGKVPVPGASGETYQVKTLHSEGHTASECKAKVQSAIVESASSAKGTFRIESTGTYDGQTRSLVATFTHPGFLNYVYFTNYEILDPSAQSPSPTNCEHYYSYRKEHTGLGCVEIQFAEKDKINGPLHTNDAADVCEKSGNWPTFGRTSSDMIEMNGGYHAGCSAMTKIHTVGTYTEKAPTLVPPETDSELLATAGYKFQGKTFLELKAGSPNTIAITSVGPGGTKIEPTKAFPSNGVIYVENSASGCGLSYTPFKTDYTDDSGCGNVYVRGTYTESLTIAAANDIIIDGNLKTAENSSSEPTGAATLGLIATNFVRVYHPVAKEYTVEHKLAVTETPKIVHKKARPTESEKTLEQAPTIIEKTLEQVPTTTEKTLEQAPTTKENTLEQPPTTKEKTVEEAGTGSKGENCKSGFTYSKTTKKCVGKVLEESCPAGYTLSNKKCTEKVVEEKCPAGYTLSNKKCTEKVSEETCPSGYTLRNKKCTEKVIEEKCANGYTLTEGECISVSTEEACGTGYTLNHGHLCVATCPNGQSYVEAEGLCVAKCENGDQSAGAGICEYKNSSSGCDAPNLNSAQDPYKWGSLISPVIDAAILSTAHSFIVDNYLCNENEHLGNLNIWGSIAQFWRGPVGSGEAGYTKNYNYDERLATEQPPNFLSPSTTAWKMTRVTAPQNGFTG